ncbi:MAG: hypothetical protein KME25_30880 [Symplocastrum torsivum CPER-KK1]|uniref:Uncharacterized protein n=1 Tax=Symplocastrum torsivum CPER-KK1 TaxID=450513 RepID=A0A951PTN9_9CYAN|nr:hypothetical protein [Symplocastrum torsivum CPER-KK1]
MGETWERSHLSTARQIALLLGLEPGQGAIASKSGSASNSCVTGCNLSVVGKQLGES